MIFEAALTSWEIKKPHLYWHKDWRYDDKAYGEGTQSSFLALGLCLSDGPG